MLAAFRKEVDRRIAAIQQQLGQSFALLSARLNLHDPEAFTAEAVAQAILLFTISQKLLRVLSPQAQEVATTILDEKYEAMMRDFEAHLTSKSGAQKKPVRRKAIRRRCQHHQSFVEAAAQQRANYLAQQVIEFAQCDCPNCREKLEEIPKA